MNFDRLFSDTTSEVVAILDRSLEGRELSEKQGAVLLRAEGADLYALMRVADLARREDRGDDISFVINRNMNFTNVCSPIEWPSRSHVSMSNAFRKPTRSITIWSSW